MERSGFPGIRLKSTVGVRVHNNSGALASTTEDFGAVTATLQNRITTAANLVISWRGNFSFLDNNGDGVCTTADLSSGYARVSVKDGLLSSTVGTGAQTDGTVSAIASDCSEIQTVVAAYTDNTSQYQYLNFSVGNGASSTYNSAGAREIPAQTITATVSYRTAGGTVLSQNTAAVGIYSYDSQSAAINYMPYGAGISRIVYVNSSATSPVVISAVNEAGTACASTNFPEVTATATRPTSISASMDAGVAACYGASYTGKVRFTVSLSQIRSRGQYTLSLPELTMVPRQANQAALNGGAAYGNDLGFSLGRPSTGIYAAGTVLQQKGDFTAAGAASTATADNGVVGTIANSTGTIERIGDAFEIYSAYNVNGNRVQVINETNGR